MSRRYRVQVCGTLRRVIKAEDCVHSQLELLEVLPAEQMAELLAQELVARGFEREKNALSRRQGDTEVSVELATGTVTVRSSTATQVEVAGQQEGYAFDEQAQHTEQMKKHLDAQLQQSLAAKAEKQQRELQGAVTDRLERELGDIAAELDQAVNRARAEALKRKAAQLGRVKQLAEDPQTGTLTIVVEV